MKKLLFLSILFISPLYSAGMTVLKTDKYSIRGNHYAVSEIVCLYTSRDNMKDGLVFYRTYLENTFAEQRFPTISNIQVLKTDGLPATCDSYMRKPKEKK